MKIEQFEDKGLAHYAYAILSECEQQIMLIDPARNPQPYYDFARQHQAQIVGVIETHPHADFISAHLEIHRKTGAIIYASKLVDADYPHQSFDEGDTVILGKMRLRALNTPGHSPDSISVVLEHEGSDRAVFTGDTLFVGDVGRPDLRENVGNLRSQRQELARQLYHSTRDKLMPLDDHVIVYPAHGAGSLCGKAMSDANQSTIGQERMSNPALQEMSEHEFVDLLLQDQPFIPKYFGYDVELNKQGAPDFRPSVEGVRIMSDEVPLESGVPVVDTRPGPAFRQCHARGAINLQNGSKFETWLGSVIGPDEDFYLLATDEDSLRQVIEKAAKIGYETKIKGARVYQQRGEASLLGTDVAYFRDHLSAYTILDVRNAAEAQREPKFDRAINIPLPELRERTAEVPTDKPVVVHCAGGYRSAAASSILQSAQPDAEVHDLGEAIKEF